MPTLTTCAPFDAAPLAWTAPSERPLWQALLSGQVVVIPEGAEADVPVTVTGRSCFGGLIARDPVARTLAQRRLDQAVWSCDYRWPEDGLRWAMTQVDVVPLPALQRCAGEVFEDLPDAHAHDGLLAYAWWGGLVTVFNALQTRGLTVDRTSWRGEPLGRWIERTRDHAGAVHQAWAGALCSQREQVLLRRSLAAFPTVPTRDQRRL